MLDNQPDAAASADIGPASEADLVRMAVALGALEVGGPLSASERALVERATMGSAFQMPFEAEEAARGIEDGEDPLGTLFYALRSQSVRRQTGAIYTPPLLVRPMVDWIMGQDPQRVVDAGAGSGRFSVAVARNLPDAQLVAVDADPLATLMTRAALAVIGHRRASVIQADYTRLRLPPLQGRTAFVGNPPYVRHHNLDADAKTWAQQAAKSAGHTISGLAGLHAYFFLATALLGRRGDVGSFVTSAEWLDVNYGAIIRQLLLDNLGGRSIHVLEPTALPFEDTATTAAISCFRIGDRPSSIRLRSVKTAEEIGGLEDGQPVARERLVEARRWSPLVRTRQQVPEGYIELGELCRVHRGQVTGLNKVWVTAHNEHRLPDHLLFPSVTRARELFAAGNVLGTVEGLRRVIDLPPDLDLLDGDERRMVERFLRKARRLGAAQGYIAQNRKAWWSVGLRAPAPILATYMARRPPAFVRNLAEARHINIAHGLYPRGPIPDNVLDRLAAALRGSISVAQGRTYAGGLTKFEPKEMERLLVPDLPLLMER
jgi:adenine-specific DNA-methyltransferase